MIVTNGVSMASPIITWFGGVSCEPMPWRMNDSTTMVRTNEVTVRITAGKSAKDVTAGVKAHGWTIGSGYGPLKDTTIRIGHMGDHTVERLEELLALLETLAR